MKRWLAKKLFSDELIHSYNQGQKSGRHAGKMEERIETLRRLDYYSPKDFSSNELRLGYEYASKAVQNVLEE